MKGLVEQNVDTVNRWIERLDEKREMDRNLKSGRAKCRGPLSLVSTIEELLGRKGSGSGLENREYGRRDPSC
jgi:hypothetical protein